MRTNLLNDLSNVLKKGTSMNLLPKMDREWIGNDSRMDRQSLGKIFRYAAMITLLLTLACGNVWGETYTWSFANESGSISKTTTNFTSTSGSKILTYDGGDGCAFDGDSGNKYLKMGGKSGYSNETPNDRFFKFLAPSSSGTVSISYAGTVNTTEISAGSNGSLVWDVITPTANETSTSKIISGLTAGSTYVYISCPANKSYIKSITWTDAALPYERVYYSEMKTCVWETALESGASFTAHNNIGFNGKAGSGWNSYFSNYLTISSSGGYATATFSPALALTSNGVDKGRIRVYFSSTGDNRNISLEMNGNSAGSYNEAKAYRTYVAEYTIPDATENLSTLKMFQSGNSGIVIFAIEVLTYSSSTWYLPGSWYYNFERADNVKFTGSPLTLTLHLNEHTSYDFKLVKNDGSEHWYDNSGGKVITTMRDWSIAGTEGGNNSVLFTGPEGDYTFTLDPVNKSLNIDYPNIHPDDNYMYFENTDVWGTVGAYIYSNDSWKVTSWEGTPSLANSTVEICGHTYHYCVTPRYSDGSTFNNVIFRNLANSGQSSDRSAKKEYHGGKWSDNNSATIHEFNLYTISFAGNGNTGGSMSAIEGICPNSNQEITANAFEKTDYIFTGWHANVDVKVGESTISAGDDIANEATIKDISSDITLTAQWTHCSGPSITANGRSGITDGAHYVGDALGTLSVTASAGNGGELSYKWYQYDDAGGKVKPYTEAYGTNNTSTYNIPSNATCTARHYFCVVSEEGCSTTREGDPSGALTLTEAPTLYTVTYNVNGGGSVSPTSATQASSSASVTLPTPTWSGYTIEGWYNSGTKLGNATASYTPTADITAYAHWTDNISGKVFSYIDNSYGDKFKGFTGYGWVAKDSTGRNKTFTNGTTGVQYIVASGAWDKKNNAISALAKLVRGTTSMSVVIPTGKIATVKISYGAYNKSNQLTVNSSNQTALSTALTDGMTNVQVYNALTEVTLNSQTGTLTLGSSTGNIYIGRVSAVITGYTVSYAAGTYGSGSLASGTKTHGSNFTLSSSDNAFTRDGYTYDGWSTNADGSTKDYNLGGSYTTDAAITLYPHWVGAASISATLESDGYMRIGAAGMQLSISITGASSGWYYRVKNTDNDGYQLPDMTTYTTTSWTMTSTIGAATNNYVVELYDGSDNKMATSNTITVYGETGHPMTIAAGDNGSVSPSGVVYANGDHLHPEITATPASGYHFVNWTLSNANATLADASSATTTITNASGACTITANFEADATLYTVTFNSNGGSAVSPATQASAGASIAKPSDPTRASYEFDGWYATAGEKISWPYTPEADITLYARWEEECDAEGVAKSTTDVPATGYTTYIEKGGDKVVFTDAPTLGFKYKDAAGNTINNSTTAVVRNNAYKCQISSDSSNKGSIKTNNAFSNVDSISFYFAASDKSGCKIAVWCSTDNFSADSTQLLSATTYADNNSEFKLKTLAIPSGKKASALRFKFRFTVTSSGKTSYIDSLKVYSSTSGGGTCYHVYYHGNGAESGFVSDTTSYSDGAKATVLSYNDSRYPLTKEGYDFQGWATSAGGSAAYSDGQKITIDGADVHLYAKWATASTALVTWKMKTADNEAWATTTGTGTTDGTNISSIGTSHDEGDDKAKNSATAKTAMASGEVSGTAAPDKSARFTFSIGATKQVEISKFDCKVFNVSSGSRTYKAQITDAAGNVYNSTNTVAVSAEASLTDASFVFGSGKILRGAVTIRIYAWGSGSEFRMGPDVKFYGTVQDYACATPSAPTISGVSEYVPGQTITLTASHDGENYDNLTTYTWYKGDTWGSKSQVKAAATGSAGYTFTKASCAAGDAGKYWCEVANGTCNAHNSEGYDIIVYPTYSITYNLNGGTNPVDPAPKTSYTQFDEDYTLPIPTKDGFVFAGWYEASDFSGVPAVVLESGSIGDKQYWAKWGTEVTVGWTVTKVDSKLYRGGGGYSVTAVINQVNWDDNGDKDDLVLTATEGVTLKNVVKSINGDGKAQVFADFDITTGLAEDATSITFTLEVPAAEPYGPKVAEHEEDLTDCGGGASGYTEFFSMIPKANTCSITNTTAYNASNHYTTCDCTSSATITTGGSVTFGLYSSGTGTTDKFWEYNSKNGGWKQNVSNSWMVLYSADQFVAGDSIVITNGNSSGSGYYTIVAAASNNTSDYRSASQVATPSTTNPAKNTDYYYILPVGFVSSNYLVIRSATTSSYYVGTIKAYHAGAKGGVTPTLTWDDGDENIATTGIAKNTSDNDFIYTARQNKNSLGAITYSSSDATVATVNATTGQVHLVGAAGTATITATIAASGCFSSANVSYTITVTDDCDDEAGTITTEDLGCAAGIKMTVTGHTTTASTSYQWYKVGSPDVEVGTDQDNFTATEAGSYYVIVTNTGDRHCAKRSTNTVTVEAKAAATVAKIVDSWYVKNGRRTPDIELVKTTNATGFTVTNGSSVVIWNSDSTVKTGFGGCGFHMDENGIIYLNGTKDGGAATTGLTAGDETLTITAIGCGGNASQNITIHKQAATNYKEIAFVADGGKGMKKDSITVGHGDGTELYEYLDSVGTAAENRLFKLSERNIYWTTDEKAIREEYSQFDAILITDDPSTNTVVKDKDDYKTKGYVNAFGTMVDVRPIFTMEAYVSALKNWGSKGIAGNPESPNPRQYEMRLECKDHEIYGAGLPDPEDGTNVWEEVIDGETFRHVILVDSTKGVYKGVAYNAETAGNKKPALQGFTGEAAGSLLGLGRILEGTLQAAIERQEEPAARLLVMGINAKALQPTCALTNEGKTVIKNILVYLLKTNMEEVDDCSNYFTGKYSSDWNNASNWSKGNLPSSEAKVRILAPCVISGVQPHVAQVAIVSSGKSSIRETATGSANCNGSLTINANGALIVEGEVLAAEAPHFAHNDLKPTTVNDLVLNTSSTNQAALIFNNDEGKTQATVNLYSLGRTVSETNQFQYFAIPMSYLSVNPTFANETHGITIYTYVWLEATGWERRGYYTDLYAFEGIGITTNKTTAHEYTMKGTLASTKDQEIPITADGKKLNLIGNSWTAPIQISELEASDFGDASSAVEQVVYIYSTGHGKSTADGKTEAAGQWLAIPFEAARFDAWDGLKVIPSMQAFQIKTAGEGTLTLDYDKHVRGGSTDLTAKLRAPQRRAAHDGVELMRIRVADSKTHTDLYLFEGDQFSDAFDNGWEANYRVGTNESAKLYARVATGVMSVAAMSDLEGTPIYFIPGQETEYTFTFGGNGMGYYLNDLKLQQSTLISEGAEYSFTYEKGDAAARFMISATPYESPQVTTGTENVQTEEKPRKILYNNKLYIIYNGHVYSAEGAIVK